MSELFGDLFGRPKYKKMPVDYASSKAKLLSFILPQLPYRKKYVECCVGCSPIFLNRKRSKFEVINDKYTGITNFYRILQNPTKLAKFQELMLNSIYSKEQYYFYMTRMKEIERTFNKFGDGDEYYAFYWFYTLINSLYSNGKVFIDTTSDKIVSAVKSLPKSWGLFDPLRDRLVGVFIENCDFEECSNRWTGEDTVKYIDPPYWGTSQTFCEKFTEADHFRLLEHTMNDPSFVAISNYQNQVYDSYFLNRKGCAVYTQKVASDMADGEERIEALYVKN